MKRTSINAWIDILAFVAFLFLLTIGLLLEYQLPPGSGGHQGYGTGRGALDRNVQLVWGWTRHEWGQIHYWIALTLMTVLAIHLLLHWKWIVCTVRGKPSTASGHRLFLGVLGLAFAVLLSAVPLLSAVTNVSRSELWDSTATEVAESDRADNEPNADSREAHGQPASIRGSMSLREIADAAGIPVTELVGMLHLPTNVDVDMGAGRLMRQHGLTMSDVRDVLASSHKIATTESNR
jgi:hypothetical protein